MKSTVFSPRAWHGLMFACLILVGLGINAVAHADQQDWLIGTWELHYDPDGDKTDWLIFKANGDVISRGPQGNEYRGMYIETAEGVKTVFTHEGQDVIATFHHGDNKQTLKIVTSRSGEESIYKKVE